MLADLIKIHCLTHGSTFPMSRTSRTVVCKEGAEEHTLSTNFPKSGLWVYCCNCQTFIAWDKTLVDVSIKECPFCTSSLNPRAYCCDHCAITMVDYDDQTLRKHHAVLSWGMPQPACPGCHNFPGATPRLHFCQALKTSLATARELCPFCSVSASSQVEFAGASGLSLGMRSPAALKPEADQARAQVEAKALEPPAPPRFSTTTVKKESELRRKTEAVVEPAAKAAEPKAATEPAVTVVRLEPDWGRREAAAARAKAEVEVQARIEAEARARTAEKLLEQAEAAARTNAQTNTPTERKGRRSAASTPTRPGAFSQSQKDKLTIALYSSLAGVLFILLLLLVGTMIRIASN
jgi:hypothetical protein